MDKRDDELTRTEAAAYLGYTYTGFSRIVPKIPRRKFRNRTYFLRSKLDAFRKSQSVDHAPVPEGAA